MPKISIEWNEKKFDTLLAISKFLSLGNVLHQSLGGKKTRKTTAGIITVKACKNII